MDKIIVFAHSWGNYFLNIYHNVKSSVFFINEIQDNHETNKKELLIKFYFHYYLKFLANLLPFLKPSIDNYELIKIRISNGKLNRNIIYKNTGLTGLVNRVKEINTEHVHHIFNENELMMMKRFPVLDIYYKDENSNKVSIKNIITEYADKSKFHRHNSINNILKLEKIRISNNKIYVTYLKLIKKEDKEINIEDDYHVSDLYDYAI